MTSTAIDSIIAHVRGRPSRTWSLVISFFGDAIVPRGGEADLSTLTAFCAGLAIDAGAVRTALSRLVRDGWFTREKRGRNSFYRLSPHGHDVFASAAVRIYAPPAPAATPELTLLLVPGASRTGTLAAELAEKGYGSPQAGVWITPHIEAELPPMPDLLRLAARGDAVTLRSLAARSWPLQALGGHYRDFITAFAPLASEIANGVNLDDAQAMLARVLLINEYRRIALRDPHLPSVLLPEDWPSAQARSLGARLYAQLFQPAESWLDRQATTSNGTALPPSLANQSRFEG